MFESLNSALRGQVGAVEDCGLTLISHTPTASPSAVVTSFLASCLSSGRPVCLVTLHNTWGHYCSIGSKVGLNLRQQQEQDKVKVIDGLKLLAGILDASSEQLQDHEFNFAVHSHHYPLANLYKLVQQTVQPWKDCGVQFQIILENVTGFLNLNASRKDIQVFVNQCWTLVGRSSPKRCGSLMVVTTIDERDDEANQLTKIIAHSASLHMSLQALTTGQSRDVHGLLRITTFDRDSPFHGLPSVQNFQYKLEEKDMRVFAPGTSTSIL